MDSFLWICNWNFDKIWKRTFYMALIFRLGRGQMLNEIFSFRKKNVDKLFPKFIRKEWAAPEISSCPWLKGHCMVVPSCRVSLCLCYWAMLISPPLHCEHFFRTFCFIAAQRKIVGQFWKRETIILAYNGHFYAFTDQLSFLVAETGIPWKVSPPLHEKWVIFNAFYKYMFISEDTSCRMLPPGKYLLKNDFKKSYQATTNSIKNWSR